MKTKNILVTPAILISLLTAGTASASFIPYPTVGVLNPVTYSFTATATGAITAYFAAENTASYTEQIGLMINGVNTGIYGLNNKTSAVGDSISWNVTAGDKLVFVDQVSTIGNSWYSDTALNSDHVNHVYSTAYTGSLSGFPVSAGTYVAFEDLLNGGDKNYHDDTFVVTNVSAVPLPGAVWLMLGGLMGVFGLNRRKSAVV